MPVKYTMGAEPKGPALLFVFAPWCGHCTAAKPAIAKAERNLRGQMPVYAVDGDDPAHAALLKRFRVEGFPTIFYVNAQGRRVRFPDGSGREADAITAWARKRLSMP